MMGSGRGIPRPPLPSLSTIRSSPPSQPYTVGGQLSDIGALYTHQMQQRVSPPNKYMLDTKSFFLCSFPLSPTLSFLPTLSPLFPYLYVPYSCMDCTDGFVTLTVLDIISCLQ